MEVLHYGICKMILHHDDLHDTRELGSGSNSLYPLIPITRAKRHETVVGMVTSSERVTGLTSDGFTTISSPECNISQIRFVQTYHSTFSSMVKFK